ncbi:MAG: tetratricopeptide repeat protein [Bacteroidetes bacterium]|nr:tetratricopeptide repeat protein [Bacteroidota bacterium]
MKPLLAAGLVLVGLTTSCRLFRHKPTQTHAVGDSVSLREIYYNGELAYNSGNWEEARRQFQVFARDGYAPANAWYRLACIAWKQGKGEEALALNQKAIKADTSNGYFHLLDAEIYKSGRAYEKAGDIYSHLADRHTRQWSYYQDAGRMYAWGGVWAKQIDLCNRWEKAFGLREDIAENRVNAWMQQGKYLNAAMEYEKLAAKYPERRQYRVKLADALSIAGQNERASRLYDSLITEDPGNTTLLATLCNYYWQRGKKMLLWKHTQRVVANAGMTLEQKQSCLSHFMDKLPDNPWYDSLEAPLLSLCKTNGTDPRSWYMLADWYYFNQKWAAAVPAFSEAVRSKPSDFQLWLKYTECLERSKNYNRLAAVADSLIEVFPVNPRSYSVAARSRELLKDWKKAKELCETGLSYAMDAEYIRNLNHILARVLDGMGETQAAITKYEQLLQTNPEDANAMNNLAYLYTEKGMKPDEALKLVKRALEIAPGTASFMDTYGWILFQQADYAGAVRELKKSVEKDGSQGEVWEHLGDAQYKAGSTAEAVQSWKKATELGWTHTTLEKKIRNGKWEK